VLVHCFVLLLLTMLFSGSRRRWERKATVQSHPSKSGLLSGRSSSSSVLKSSGGHRQGSGQGQVHGLWLETESSLSATDLSDHTTASASRHSLNQQQQTAVLDEPRLAMGMGLYRMVPVCLFCAQFFDPDATQEEVMLCKSEV